MTIQRVFKATDEQQAIAEALLAVIKKYFPAESIAIDAGAGTGKSRTLIYLLERLLPIYNEKKIYILILQFNRSIRLEMEAKLKAAGLENVASVKTFNGLAYGAFMKRYNVKDPDREIYLDSKKYKKIARFLVERDLPGSRTKDELAEAADMLVKLFDLFRANTTRHHKTGNLCVFTGGNIYDEDVLAAYEPDNIYLMKEIAARYDLLGNIEHIEDEDVVCRLIPDMVRLGKLAFENPYSAKQTFMTARFADSLDGRRLWCDFTDQVFWCVVDQYKVFGYTLIMVDEAQDTSPLDRALVDMHIWRNKGSRMGRVVLVGDPQQAIYAFRGADNDGFYNSMRFWYIKEAFPLSVSYRVPQAIARMAAEWKPNYKAYHENIEGTIGTINRADLIEMAEDGDACISRVRSGMIALRNEFLKAGKAARILGSDLSDGIIKTLEMISEKPEWTWPKTVSYLEAHRDARLQQMREREKGEEEIERFLDDMGMVIEVVQSVPDEINNLQDAIAHIEQDLNPANQPEGGIVIATGHTVKGMEFKRVFNITPDRFPMIWKNQTNEQYVQEKNLEYVVDTRSFNEYYMLDPKAPSYLAEQKRLAEAGVDSPADEQQPVEAPALPAPVEEAPALPAPEPALIPVLPGSKAHREKSHEEAIAWAQDILTKPFVILDYETTGKAGEPCQIAVIDHTGKELLNTLVKPEFFKFEEKAIRVHGITPETVKDAPTFTSLYPQLRELLHGKIVIAYNVEFEQKVTALACQIYKLEPIEPSWHCAMLNYGAYEGTWNSYFGNWKWHKLVEATAAMGVVPQGNAHDALVDVIMTLDLIRAMAGVYVAPVIEQQPVAVPIPVEIDGEQFMIENQKGVPAGEDWLTWNKPQPTPAPVVEEAPAPPQPAAEPEPEAAPAEPTPAAAPVPVPSLTPIKVPGSRGMNTPQPRPIAKPHRERILTLVDTLEVDELDALIEILQAARQAKAEAVHA